MQQRVTATPEALELIERLRARHGDVALFQSGGCCDGSSVMCLAASEMGAGTGDVTIGELAGAPVYIDGDQNERWRHPAFVVDVAPGAATSFSLEALEDVHFVTRTKVAGP